MSLFEGEGTVCGDGCIGREALSFGRFNLAVLLMQQTLTPRIYGELSKGLRSTDEMVRGNRKDKKQGREGSVFGEEKGV